MEDEIEHPEWNMSSETEKKDAFIKCRRASCTRTILYELVKYTEDCEKSGWTYMVDANPPKPLTGWICPECTKEFERLMAS